MWGNSQENAFGREIAPIKKNKAIALLDEPAVAPFSDTLSYHLN